jgi:hypothetical protein
MAEMRRRDSGRSHEQRSARPGVRVGRVLPDVGGLRGRGSGSAPEDRLRSHWAAGAVAAVATVVGLLAVFVIATLYWGEGVLDAGGTETVRSSLFPFVGSRVAINPTDDSVAWSMGSGPLPFVSAVAIWLIVTRPWRTLRRRPATNEPDSLRSADEVVTSATSPRSVATDDAYGGGHA